MTINQHSTISPQNLDHAILVWMQELASYGIYITDAELRIQGWNSWMETASGLKRDQLLGRNLLEVFPELELRRLDSRYRNALKGEVNILSSLLHKYLLRFPSTIADASVTEMLQTARIAPLIQNNEVVGTITTIEDVTQREHQNLLIRKQAEREELISWTLAYLLRSSEPELVVKQLFPRVSVQMEVDVYFNYMMEEGTGLLRLQTAAGISPSLKQHYSLRQPGEFPCEMAAPGHELLVLSNVQDSIDPKASIPKRLDLQAYICHPLKLEHKIIGTLSFGSRTRSSFTAEEIEFTGILAQYVAIGIERGRTLKVLHEAQVTLSRHAESLEAGVRERTAKLQESIGELEAFSYSLAHDVRAPLRHIKGYATLLLEDSETKLSEESRTYIDAIVRAIQNLDSLTKDMLAFTQISRESTDPAPVDLEILLRDIVTRNPALNEPGVLTIAGKLPRVIGERVLLSQVMHNLLDNALKFVPENVPPRIIVRAETYDNSIGEPWTRIWVEDNGIGIAPEYHERIFNIFERLGNQQTGTGIGLAIVSKAVAKMRGRVGVKSTPGTGSKFWIELPKAE